MPQCTIAQDTSAPLFARLSSHSLLWLCSPSSPRAASATSRKTATKASTAATCCARSATRLQADANGAASSKTARPHAADAAATSAFFATHKSPIRSRHATTCRRAPSPSTGGSLVLVRNIRVAYAGPDNDERGSGGSTFRAVDARARDVGMISIISRIHAILAPVIRAALRGTAAFNRASAQGHRIENRAVASELIRPGSFTTRIHPACPDRLGDNVVILGSLVGKRPPFAAFAANRLSPPD